MKKIDIILMDTETRLECYQNEYLHCTDDVRKNILLYMIHVCSKIISNINKIKES